MQRFLNVVVILSLLLSSLPAGSISAASSPTPLANQPISTQLNSAIPSPSRASSLPFAYLQYVDPLDTQPLLVAAPTNLPTLYNIRAEAQQPVGPYRTTVTIHGAADLARIKSLGVKVLMVTANSATVLADRLQLEKLAKLHFFPIRTELVSKLKTHAACT